MGEMKELKDRVFHTIKRNEREKYTEILYRPTIPMWVKHITTTSLLFKWSWPSQKKQRNHDFRGRNDPEWSAQIEVEKRKPHENIS